jgi:hypothetical protein
VARLTTKWLLRCGAKWCGTDDLTEGEMDNHVRLNTVCPNNHNLTVTFSRSEFESELKSGGLVFHCNTCDANWPPTREEIDKIREQFSGKA